MEKRDRIFSTETQNSSNRGSTAEKYTLNIEGNSNKTQQKAGLKNQKTVRKKKKKTPGKRGKKMEKKTLRRHGTE